jgi:hypothetical protein
MTFLGIVAVELDAPTEEAARVALARLVQHLRHRIEAAGAITGPAVAMVLPGTTAAELGSALDAAAQALRPASTSDTTIATSSPDA